MVDDAAQAAVPLPAARDAALGPDRARRQARPASSRRAITICSTATRSGEAPGSEMITPLARLGFVSKAADLRGRRRAGPGGGREGRRARHRHERRAPLHPPPAVRSGAADRAGDRPLRVRAVAAAGRVLRSRPPRNECRRARRPGWTRDPRRRLRGAGDRGVPPRAADCAGRAAAKPSCGPPGSWTFPSGTG